MLVMRMDGWRVYMSNSTNLGNDVSNAVGGCIWATQLTWAMMLVMLMDGWRVYMSNSTNLGNDVSNADGWLEGVYE